MKEDKLWNPAMVTDKFRVEQDEEIDVAIMSLYRTLEEYNSDDIEYIEMEARECEEGTEYIYKISIKHGESYTRGKIDALTHAIKSLDIRKRELMVLRDEYERRIKR